MTAFRRVLPGILIPFAVAATVHGQGAPPLRRLDLIVGSVSDSGGYFLYLYRASNDPGSAGGVAILSIDLSAATGTGFAALPASGRFTNGPLIPGVKDARDHVPVGPLSPQDWEAFMNKDGTLDWYGSHGGFEGDIDSIGPANTLRGFGLRSPYLPGLRRTWAAPTFRSCCSHLRPRGTTNEPENPNPKEFRIATWAVGPAVRPQDLSVAVVRADLHQVCESLHWVTDGAVCGRLEAHLAHQELRAFMDELDSNHGAQGVVTDNAYWLLRVNAAYLLSRSN